MDAKILEKNCQKVLDHLAAELATLHAGRATVAMLDSVTVEVQGKFLRLREMAALSTPDGRTIAIQPWDRGTTRAIEKAILLANLGFTPVVDADRIRCLVPEMSLERRRELAKRAATMAEAARVAARAVRRDAMELWKTAKKNEKVSEDELKRREKEVQKAIDGCGEKIEGIWSKKEKELLSQ
ncbi:MAG: ribosome recycling factor [Puniceicoccales bacterium]|jgi:ribosome recycling factor|nr:ribosome recycling factor [Puniceicoccales bacterium]